MGGGGNFFWLKSGISDFGPYLRQILEFFDELFFDVIRENEARLFSLFSAGFEMTCSRNVGSK